MKHKKPSNELVRLVKAFGYSIQGLKCGLRQPAFRIELLLLIALSPVALWVTADSVERILLIGSLFVGAYRRAYQLRYRGSY